MAYKREKNTNQYLTVFKQTPSKTYKYMEVMQCFDEGSKFVANAGLLKDFEISNTDVIDSDTILKSTKHNKVSKNIVYLDKISYDKPNFIAMVLGEDTRRDVYEELVKRIGGEPDNAQLAEEFAMRAYKIGQYIKEISRTTALYVIRYREDLTFDVIPEMDRDILNKYVLDDTPWQQETTVGEGRNNTTAYTVQLAPDFSAPRVQKKPKVQSVKLDANEIIERLKKKVRSQDQALEDVVYALVLNQEILDSNIEDADQWKTNILIDGPSGSGKTFIIESVAEELNLPCCVTGITNYSGTGYRGSSLSDILARLLKATDGDLELAQRGIIALDEFDKLSNNEQDNRNSNEMHQSIQDELLSYISGTKIDVEYNGRIYDFDTTNLSFIAMGAFDKMHKRKIAITEKKISESNDTFDGISREYEVTKEDYIAEGLRRELLGRFQTLTHTNELGIEELKDILLNSSISRLKKFELIGKLRHKTIIVTDDAINCIVQTAFKNNTGARALGDSIENIISLLNRDINDSTITEIVITPEHVKEAQKKQIIQYVDPNTRGKTPERR